MFVILCDHLFISLVLSSKQHVTHLYPSQSASLTSPKAQCFLMAKTLGGDQNDGSGCSFMFCQIWWVEINRGLHPRILTWNLKIPRWKRRNVYKPPILLDSMAVFGAEKIRTEFLGRSSPHLDKQSISSRISRCLQECISRWAAIMVFSRRCELSKLEV